jgi:hypothetical protein
MLKIFKYWQERRRARRIVSENVDEKRIKRDDRNILETVIIPYVLAERDPGRVLDIGREEYEHFYNQFFAGRELWTMDIDPERTDFGSKGRHITDSVANVREHFNPDYFGFVLMNGVFGWGLNQKDEIEKALSGIYECLVPDGLLVFGYNKTRELTPVALEDLKALKRFEQVKLPVLRSRSYTCATGEHTYNFYQKPLAHNS